MKSGKVNRHTVGNAGELEVIELIPCIECGARYELLPVNFPLFDLKCSTCGAVVQVKTINPKSESIRTRSSFGGGWRVLKEMLDQGDEMPPVIINFKWTMKDGTKRQEIRLYRAIPAETLRIYALREGHKQAGYEMYRYRELNTLPYSLLYEG